MTITTDFDKCSKYGEVLRFRPPHSELCVKGRSHIHCAFLRAARCALLRDAISSYSCATRYCTRDSNSVYFDGGVHTYAALRAAAPRQ